jgi:hypothetical protein
MSDDGSMRLKVLKYHIMIWVVAHEITTLLREVFFKKYYTNTYTYIFTICY